MQLPRPTSAASFCWIFALPLARSKPPFAILGEDWIFSFSIRPVLPAAQAGSAASCDGPDNGTSRQ
jgi:hypothetical protein